MRFQCNFAHITLQKPFLYVQRLFYVGIQELVIFIQEKGLRCDMYGYKIEIGLLSDKCCEHNANDRISRVSTF